VHTKANSKPSTSRWSSNAAQSGDAFLSNPPKLVGIRVEQISLVQPLPHKCLMPASLVLADLLRCNFFFNEKS